MQATSRDGDYHSHKVRGVKTILGVGAGYLLAVALFLRWWSRMKGDQRDMWTDIEDRVEEEEALKLWHDRRELRRRARPPR